MSTPSNGQTVFVDLSNLCRDRRLLPAGVDADLSAPDRFSAAITHNPSMSIDRIHCVADSSLLPILPRSQRRLAREMEQSGDLDFSAVADERLLSLAFDDATSGLVASMDFFDDFRRSYPEIQGSSDKFIGWNASGSGELTVGFRDMGVHSHQRLSRKEESAEFKARRLRRDSIVQRAAATRYRCSDPVCIVAQLWPDHLPDLPLYDDATDRVLWPSCENELETGTPRLRSKQLIVCLHGVEKVRIMVDAEAPRIVGRQHEAGCYGLQSALGVDQTQAVSRQHVRLSVVDGAVLVEDLSSRNGSVLRHRASETSLDSAGPVEMKRSDT